MITALIYALVYVAITCLIGFVILYFVAQIPGCPPVVILLGRAVIALICILILLNALLGGSWGPPHRLLG
jgi:hypothetical protein